MRLVKLYDHPASGNCLKARILLRQLGIEFESVVVDLFAGETRQPQHLARNPDGRVPVLALDSGALIPESAAILLYLAEGTPFLPTDRLERARVHQWLFFEQNQVEAGLAVARFMALTGQVPKRPEVYADRLRQGRNALRSLDRGLVEPFVAGSAYTVADTALYGYVHCAGEAGAEPREYTRIAEWLDRVEATPGFVNDLEPVPAHVSERPL
jgi:glutathione S-transferase